MQATRFSEIILWFSIYLFFLKEDGEVYKHIIPRCVMKQLFLVISISLTLLGCDRPNKPNDNKDNPTTPVRSDNMRINATYNGMSETSEVINKN